jgi:hypothetical protein
MPWLIRDASACEGHVSVAAGMPTATTVCENQTATPVDLSTTLRVAHRVHSRNSNNSSNRPEQNQKCVTHVPGQNCYLCRRLLNHDRDAAELSGRVGE